MVSDRGLLVGVSDETLPAEEASHDVGGDERGQENSLELQLIHNLPRKRDRKIHFRQISREIL